MIYDANGKVIDRCRLSGPALDSLNASLLEAMKQEAFFTRSFLRESALVDSRGNPFPSLIRPIGETITVRMPTRWRHA